MRDDSFQKAEQPSITDSPWFWTYVFATAGLTALILMGPRYLNRQSQLERQYLARQRAGQTTGPEALPSESLASPSSPAETGRQAADRSIPTAAPESRERIISLKPLYAILALALAAAWCVIWWQRFRRSARRKNYVAVPSKESIE